jgi:hypothetical protein
VFRKQRGHIDMIDQTRNGEEAIKSLVVEIGLVEESWSTGDEIARKPLRT